MPSDGPPYAYQLRVSPRARRVRLEISPAHGLVVIVPRRFALTHLPEILARQQAWIEATFARHGRPIGRPIASSPPRGLWATRIGLG